MHKLEYYKQQALRSARESCEAAEQAHEQCNPGLAQQFYDDARDQEKEAARLQKLINEVKL